MQLDKKQHETGQYKKSPTWKRCNMKKVQHGTIQHEKSATCKECNMKWVEEFAA